MRSEKYEFYFFLGELFLLLQSVRSLRDNDFDYKRRFFSDNFVTLLVQRPKDFDNLPLSDYFVGKYSVRTLEIFEKLSELWDEVQEDLIPFTDRVLQVDKSRFNAQIMFSLDKLNQLLTKVR